jgi:hypothetical protein
LNLFCNVMLLQAETMTPPDEPLRTIEEINRELREYIGLTANKQTKRQPDQVDSDAPWAWTGSDYPVGPLMHLAVTQPKGFCELFAAAFLRPSKKRRAAALRVRYSQ